MFKSNEDHLTRRQKECLFFLVTGMTVKEIAAGLNLSPRTVEHYVESIKNKYSCRSRSQLIKKALRQPFVLDRLIMELRTS